MLWWRCLLFTYPSSFTFSAKSDLAMSGISNPRTAQPHLPTGNSLVLRCACATLAIPVFDHSPFSGPSKQETTKRNENGVTGQKCNLAMTYFVRVGLWLVTPDGERNSDTLARDDLRDRAIGVGMGIQETRGSLLAGEHESDILRCALLD
ncbi:hypothetical protein B0H65DRAFT_457219 [Neurospora tetraspora]|uniref:Secreted protein n=1 Tax=Neurospora tetraspora TaxID=94610 RepID=A0AAE0JKS2_9PEZI|nr:hypothetical protein B0H65DRAFT_457219 [Neurospora tetraspora]